MKTDLPQNQSPDLEKPAGVAESRVRILIEKWGSEIGPILLALLGSFIIGGILIAFSDENPLQAYARILEGAFGSFFAFSSTLARAMPIIGAGIAAGWAFKAGLFNIGGEGQLVLGGLSAIAVALYVPLPGFLVLILAIVVAMLAGGLWSWLSGWFETQFDVPILVSSLLMNFLALGFVSYMINFALLEPGGARSQTPMIADGAQLPRLVNGTALSFGLFLVIAQVIITTFVLRRTASGYELRMFGANREFAIAGGIDPVRMTLQTMFYSGVMAGLMGAIQVLGVHYRLIDGALNGPGYAWTGLMAAILANNNPIGIVVAGIFFAGVQTGASGMERAMAVPSELSFVVQAVLILLVASREAFRRVQRRDTA
jgi:general nucleoside transport system permease protein